MSDLAPQSLEANILLLARLAPNGIHFVCGLRAAVTPVRRAERLGNRIKRRQVDEQEERRDEPHGRQVDGEARQAGRAEPRDAIQAEVLEEPVEGRVGRVEQPPPGECSRRAG